MPDDTMIRPIAAQACYLLLDKDAIRRINGRQRMPIVLKAVVLDLFSRMVVGWFMATIQDATLVVQALQMAVARRRPQARLREVIHYANHQHR